MKHPDFNKANQCPAEGGNAVFKARGLLAIANEEELLYENDANCSQPLFIGGNFGGVSGAVAASNIQLFPNPGKDLLNLKWEDMAGTEGQASLKDLMGRTVLVLALDMASGNAELDLTGLQAGIYFCELRVDNKPVFAEKYVLIK